MNEAQVLHALASLILVDSLIHFLHTIRKNLFIAFFGIHDMRNATQL